MLEMAGTFDALSEIAAQRSLPVQVRQQSIIQLKNSSVGHWKSRRYVRVPTRAVMQLTAGAGFSAKSKESI